MPEPSDSTPDNDAPEEEPPSFSSSHTASFPALLRELGISLLVSTYQAGKLIVLRAEGETLNTHFRHFSRPMGLAYEPVFGRLAVGTHDEVWQFRNQPGVAAKLPGETPHDAAFLPRRRLTTGDIRIHEIAWLENEIWAVNTRFSCLCTFDADHSFVPRWRPKFVSALAPEDRCHLNGFAIVDERVKYVTCLGLTDTAGGWRENKVSGGCILEVESSEPIVRGLCMPHSPRVHAGRHWVLDSGHGGLATFDPATGQTTEVTRMPGFTRGMDFCGDIAFIGLSQVRETATFSGIPLVDEVPKRTCGVWAIDLRTGRTLAFLQFEGIVQEIFAIQVLPMTFPDVLNEKSPMVASAFVLPEEAFVTVPEALRTGK